ncbi:hypothetical protein P261_01142 [Lachnospiraceae bacterium TWA4]|nr:hypothetical protein P261_01142 [Lachnospiraceae bacterium TWA4]
MKHFKPVLLVTILLLILASQRVLANNQDVYDPEYYSNELTEENEPSIHTYSTRTKSPHTNKNYTHPDSKDGYKISLGIDVSKWNDYIDWEKVKDNGVDFTFIRIGYSTLNNGTPTLDPLFTQNLANAKKAGIKVGVYYYSQATNNKEAQDEVNFLLKYLNNEYLDLPIVYDAELGYYGSEKQYPGKLAQAFGSTKSANAWTAVARTFCEAIKEAGYTPMVYGSIYGLRDSIHGVELGKDYPIWIARYNTSLNNSKISYSGNIDFWQYTETGKVNGIKGNVDCNFYYYKDIPSTIIDKDSTTCKQHQWNDVQTFPATTTKDGSKLYTCELCKQNYTKVIPAIYAIKLSKTSFVYNGKNQLPTVVVKDKKGNVINSSEYEITYPSKSINVGNYSIKVSFKNNYHDTLTLNYKIIKKPKRLKLLMLQYCMVRKMLR